MTPDQFVLYKQLQNGLFRIEVENNAQGQPIYYGFAPRGTLTSEAKWQISFFEYDGSGFFIRETVAIPNQVWDSRASLVYA